MNEVRRHSGEPGPPGAGSAISSEKVADYSGTAEPLLPVAEASVTQRAPGPPPSDLAIYSSAQVHVLGLSHHAASVGVVVLKPDCFGVMWWEGREDCRINGALAEETVIYAQGEQDGFHAAGGVRRTTGISVRRDAFTLALAALRGIGPEDVRLDRAALRLTPGDARQFRHDVDGVMAAALGPAPDRNAGRSNPGDGFLALLLDAYLRAEPEKDRHVHGRAPEYIVRKAEERFFEAAGGPVSLADLCVAAGVSQSALYRAFHSICGDTPLAYLHKRRLNEARRLLVTSPAGRGAVKTAATSAGLTEMGRFSVEYRRLFGESPSATLRALR